VLCNGVIFDTEQKSQTLNVKEPELEQKMIL